MTSTMLNFHNSPSILADVLKIRTETIQPNDNWARYSPGAVQFTVPTNPIEFPHSKLLLRMSLDIVRDNNQPMILTDEASICNSLFTTIFDDVQIKLADTIICGRNADYNFLSYAKNLLRYGTNAKTTTLKSTLGYYEDTNGNFDVTGAANAGYEGRKILTAGTNYTQVEGVLEYDLASTGLCYPPDLRLMIKLLHADDRLRIMSPDARLYKVKIRAIELDVDYLTLSPEALANFRSSFQSSPLLYSYYRCTLTGRIGIEQLLTEKIVTISTGQVASAYFCFFVSQKRSNGDQKLNPYYFGNQTLSYAQLNVNGRYYPSKPYMPDFDKGKDILPLYRELMASVNCLGTSSDIGLDIAQYSSSFFILAFKTATHWPQKDVRTEYENGVVTLHMKFDTPIPVDPGPLNLFVMGLYASEVRIFSDLSSVYTSFTQG